MAEGPIRLKNIVSVVAGGITAENILSFREDHIMNITPQFVPNTFQGVDVLQRSKWRELTIVVDTVNTIFFAYFTVIAENAEIATDIVVVFDLADGTGNTETWTYDYTHADNTAWISRKDFGRIEDGARRNTTEYKIITYGVKTIT